MKIIDIKNCFGNATPAVTEALKKIQPNEETLLQFEKGVYHFSSEGCFHRDISIGYLSSPDEKQILISLLNQKNVTIDGNGSEFIFLDRMFPFFVSNCQNITLKNLIIDFQYSMYTQGEVIASDETGFELEIDRSLFKVDADANGHVIFHYGDRSFSTESSCPILLANSETGQPPWDYIFAGSTSACLDNLPTGYLLTDAVETPRGIRFIYRPESRKLIFKQGHTLIFNYMPREYINILCTFCENVRLENIKMYRGGGMGIVLEHTKNFTADGVVIQVRPGRKECRSTTADGMFFSNCSGLITVRNSKIFNTMDDALNIHGFYTKIQAISNSIFRVVYANPAHQGNAPYAAGDTVVFSDPVTDKYRATGIVASMRSCDDKSYLVTFQGEIKNVQVGDFVKNATQTADFLFEDNEVGYVPHLRISDNGKLIVRNNRFLGIEALLCCDLIKYWYESGPIQDLTVENNTFINCPLHGDQYPVNVESTRKITSDIRNKNVRIRNNTFIGGNGRAIRVQFTDGVQVSGNRFSPIEGIETVQIRDCTHYQLNEIEN